MNYTISSKLYSFGLWFLTVTFLLLDLLTYIVVIIPDRVDLGWFVYVFFSLWFAGKIAVLTCLLFKRGPLKLAIYSVLFPLIISGVYCSLTYPSTNNLILNLGIALVAAIFVIFTHRSVISHAHN